MKLFGGHQESRIIHRCGDVEVRERDGVRTLHIGSDIVQSAMRIDRPRDLELAYTRAMMAFRLFVPDPRDCLLVGLGGGSLAKFIYHHLAGTRVEAVELRPEVVEVARSHFFLPASDARLRIAVAEASRYLRGCHGPFDAILVDAFEARAQAPAVSQTAFYGDCRAALTATGVLVVNLWSDIASFDASVRAVETAFDRRCLCLPAERPGNVIVFGIAQPRSGFAWQELEARAAYLEKAAPLGYLRFVSELRRMNTYDQDQLELG